MPRWVGISATPMNPSLRRSDPSGKRIAPSAYARPLLSSYEAYVPACAIVSRDLAAISVQRAYRKYKVRLARCAERRADRPAANTTNQLGAEVAAQLATATTMQRAYRKAALTHSYWSSPVCITSRPLPGAMKGGFVLNSKRDLQRLNQPAPLGSVASTMKMTPLPPPLPSNWLRTPLPPDGKPPGLADSPRSRGSGWFRPPPARRWPRHVVGAPPSPPPQHTPAQLLPCISRELSSRTGTSSNFVSPAVRRAKNEPQYIQFPAPSLDTPPLPAITRGTCLRPEGAAGKIPFLIVTRGTSIVAGFSGI